MNIENNFIPKLKGKKNLADFFLFSIINITSPFSSLFITIGKINNIHFDIFSHKWHKIKESLSP